MRNEALAQLLQFHNTTILCVCMQGGSPWCGICKRSLVQPGSRFFTTGNHISWTSACFVCSDPACVAAATAQEPTSSPTVPDQQQPTPTQQGSHSQLPSNQPSCIHPPQLKHQMPLPTIAQAHGTIKNGVQGCQAVRTVAEPRSVFVLRTAPSGTSLQLSVSLNGIHTPPPGRAATTPGTENVTCGTAHFGHRWLLSDRGFVTLLRHPAVGSGSAEALLPGPSRAAPGRRAQPQDREEGDSVLAGSVPESPVGARHRRNANLACVVVNPDDPATAFVATEVPVQEAYQSLADIAHSSGAAIDTDAASRLTPRSNYSGVTGQQPEPNVVACIARAVDRAAAPAQDSGAGASPLHVKIQRVRLPVEHRGSVRVAGAVWGGEGRQVLLGTACGTLFCVDTVVGGITGGAGMEGSGGEDSQMLVARKIATIPEAYGSLQALAVARLDAGEAVLIATRTHVLLIAGHGTVGALRRFEKCRALWATAVVFEDFSSGAEALTQTCLAVTQSPTAGAAHIAWLCGNVVHSVDMVVVGAAPSTSRAWCATVHNLLKEDTYSRISLPDAFVRGACLSLVVLPHYVLVLGEGLNGVPQVNSIWRASGTLAFSISVYEDIGQPVSLVLDAEDPEASLDETMAVYVLGTAGVAKLDTQEGPLAGGWDLIRAGRYTQAAEKIKQAAQGPSGVGPVGESAMWGALGQALVECGWQVAGARALGRVVPGVLHAAGGKHIRSFHDTVLQFCGEGVPRAVRPHCFMPEALICFALGRLVSFD